MCTVHPPSAAPVSKTPRSLVDSRGILGAAWLLAGLVALWFATDARVQSDGLIRYRDLVLMMTGHRPIEKFSIIQALFSIPLYLVGQLAGSPQEAVSHFNFLALTGIIIAVWRIVPRHGLKVALLLLAASMLPAYAGTYFAELFTTLCVVLGLWAASKNWALSVALIGIGVANTPATLPAAALAGLYYFFAAKRTSVAVGTLLAAVMAILEMRWKYHAFFVTAYLSAEDSGVKTDIMPFSGLPGFSYPIVLGVLAVLFSFGKGLIFFMPSLPLAIKKIRPEMPPDVSRFVNGLLFFLGGLIVVYSQWWAWYGGAAWGPRLFILACVPAAILLAFALHRAPKLIVVLLLLVSGWVCVEGVLWGLGNMNTCLANHYALESLCWYAPEYSPLLNGFVFGFAAVGAGKIVYACWCAITVLAMAIWTLRGSPRRWYEQARALARAWRWKPVQAGSSTDIVDGPDDSAVSSTELPGSPATAID
jgi:hypothetical protein